MDDSITESYDQREEVTLQMFRTSTLHADEG